MSFASAIEHWRTADDLSTHLARHSPDVAPWAEGIVIHHTWKPEPRAWRGRITVDGTQHYYERKNWTSGPHLFVCVGAPNPQHDGIWQMTPLNLTGTHAGAWNRTHWGIEVVGNYDTAPWPGATRALVYRTVLALCAWRGIVVNRQSIIGHRETGSKKSCPGACIDMDIVRRDLQHLQGGV